MTLYSPQKDQKSQKNLQSEQSTKLPQLSILLLTFQKIKCLLNAVPKKPAQKPSRTPKQLTLYNPPPKLTGIRPLQKREPQNSQLPPKKIPKIGKSWPQTT